MLISVVVVGYSQSRSRPEKPLDLATDMEESMKALRELAWVAMEEYWVLLELPPPMERRVLTEGFFCWTVVVKVENAFAFSEEIVTLLVLGSRSANAQKR